MAILVSTNEDGNVRKAILDPTDLPGDWLPRLESIEVGLNSFGAELWEIWKFADTVEDFTSQAAQKLREFAAELLEKENDST